MKNKIVMPVLLAALMLLGSGCALIIVGAAAGAGAGTVVYLRGELTSEEAVSFDRACHAAEAGLHDMNYAVTEKKSDTARLTLVAYGPGSKKVQVALEKISATVTHIGVRVGTFGDEALSHQIMEKIKSHL